MIIRKFAYIIKLRNKRLMNVSFIIYIPKV